MDPNTSLVPLESQAPLVPPFTQSSQPVSKKKTNSTVVKMSLSLLVAALIGAGVGAYLYRDVQVAIQKNDNAAKLAIFESKNTKQEATSQYTPIVARSNTLKGKLNAEYIQRMSEAFNAENDHYPSLTADFSSMESSKLPAGIVLSPSATTASNGVTTVRWEYTGSATAPTGGRVTYWDFDTNTVSQNVLYAGVATASSTFVSPKS